MDYVWDSASILTSFREELSKFGVIFCSISEAVKEYPDLVRQHLGSVVRRSSWTLDPNEPLFALQARAPAPWLRGA